MIKMETFEIMKSIRVFFDQFEVDQKKVDLWHEVLRHHSFGSVQENLFAYVENYAVPPKISDLVKRTHDCKTIPNPEETRKIIQTKTAPASEEVVQRELAKMRKILGIVRREER